MIELVQESVNSKQELSHKEIARYSRHLILPEVGLIGQLKLKAAKILLIGTGGLGSPLALYLAAAGIGTIGLVDFDVVDFSNLQRQIIHTTSDVGKSKLKSAKESINAINPEIKVITYDTALSSDNALEIFKNFDIIIDGTDNFPTRYLVNDACVLLNKPNVYGSIYRFEGQASVFDPENGPCYRCLYAEPPPPGLVPSCAEGGVLGVLPGIVGTIQATETIKLILGIGEPLIGRLLLIDALDMSFRELKLKKNPECPICSSNKTITKLIDYEEFCGVNIAGEDHLDIVEDERITPEELQDLFSKRTPIQLVDVREIHEQKISNIKGSFLMPVNSVSEMSNSLDKETLTVLYCKTGIRSARALEKLKNKGFKKIFNLTGGINAWVDRIDPSQPKY
ncbi:MAG: putative adenylyltransferase/sulfurtransferase MoeZ [Candidatus Heimdallarchaeota archaeon LC_3]|nr:MAG: putative adenylyltransferase/sulfurtransferase MoeZ [Candidatus Heimdallarchaeota archaeon LC_3]